MDLHALVADGELVSAHFDFKARPLRGGELDTPANFMFRCVGDEIVETWEVLDTAEWSKAVLGPPAV
jgi:predicted SnoaL-like aldol condensation-catalyzing enzyme